MGGRIKSKVVQSTIQNKDVLEMFQGVLGSGEGAELNIEIVYPKYRKIVEHCDRFMRLLEALRDSAVMGNFVAENEHLANYVGTLREEAAALFSAPDFAALHPPKAIDQMADKLAEYSAVTREEYEAFAAAYGEIKEANLVNTIIVTCKNLVDHKKSLEDPKNLKDRFLTRSAGLSFNPLPDLPAMNFKQVYISDRLSAPDRQFVLMVLHKLYVISHDVYDAMSSPDIDVDEFVQVIMASLGDVKKHIPRCDEAFDKIADSVKLLKGNFGGYYKDFVASNNPTIIMENFVLDVSKSTNSSPRVTAQFRKIISHYRKLASQQAHNPKLRTLFQQVDKNFQELEKSSRAADDNEEESSESEAEGDLPSAAEDAAAVAHQKKRSEQNRKKRDRQRRRKAEDQFAAAMSLSLAEELDADDASAAASDAAPPSPASSADSDE